MPRSHLDETRCSLQWTGTRRCLVSHPPYQSPAQLLGIPDVFFFFFFFYVDGLEQSPLEVAALSENARKGEPGKVRGQSPSNA